MITRSAPLFEVAAIAGLVSFLGCGGRDAKTERVQPSVDPATITIYVSDDEGVAEDCAAVQPVEWEVPTTPTENLFSAAVRRTLRNVEPSKSLQSEGTLPLANYFREVRMEDGTAVVSFDEGALAYLNNTACAQAAYKAPIVRTLLEFPQTTDIAWEIEGELFTEWDA